MQNKNRSPLGYAALMMPHGMRISLRAKYYWHSAAIGFVCLAGTAKAFVPGDADIIFNAYNNAFYVSYGNGMAYYKETTAGGRAWFWGQANMIEMVVDTYERARGTGQRDMLTALCNGFLDYHGQDWSWNEYNDDVMWACIVFLKAYRITGNTAFRDRAAANFNMAWSRGWSKDLGGGMWWRTDNQSKNACDNCPAALAACLLYEALGDPAYLTKAQMAIVWVRSHLVDADTGAVYDNIDLNGIVTKWTFSYNSGTYIGASNYLFKLTGNPVYLSEALKATRYVRDHMCDSGGIFPNYGGGDGSGFNGVGIRWITQYVRDQNLWQEFYPWLKANADRAWDIRRGDNLSWNNWNATTEAGARAGFECFGSVTALQTIPPSNPAAWSMVTPQVRVSGNRANVSYQYPTDRPDVTVQLEISSDLIHWNTAADRISSTGERMQNREYAEDLPEGGGRFYRLNATTP